MPETEKREIIELPVGDILPNPFQPKSRIAVSQEVREQFANSIKVHGLMQLPVCRQRADSKYEMGDGWLRLWGYRHLLATDTHEEKYHKIPCEIRYLTDRQMADLVMEANTVRKDLNPIELAEFYAKYLQSFNITQAELAKAHNCSQGEISNTMRLLDLPEAIQELIISQKISPAHGRCLLQVKNKNDMLEFAEEAVKNGWNVVTLENVIKTYLYQQKPKLIKEEKKVDEKSTSAQIPPTSASSKTQNKVDEKPAIKQEVVHPEEIPVVTSPQETEKPVVTTTPPITSMPAETKAAVVEMAQKAAEQIKQVPAPVKVTAAPRKLILEEKEGYTTIAFSELGKMPVFTRVEGGLEAAFAHFITNLLKKGENK